MKKRITDLKKGDKVNMHEWGWYTVRKIVKHSPWEVEVFYDTSSGVSSIMYNPDFDTVIAV